MNEEAYFKFMLGRGEVVGTINSSPVPCKALSPSGEWADGVEFTISIPALGGRTAICGVAPASPSQFRQGEDIRVSGHRGPHSRCDHQGAIAYIEVSAVASL